MWISISDQDKKTLANLVREQLTRNISPEEAEDLRKLLLRIDYPKSIVDAINEAHRIYDESLAQSTNDQNRKMIDNLRSVVASIFASIASALHP